MFNTLIASKPKRKSLLNSRTVAASIVAHALLLGGAGYAAVNAPEKRAVEEEQVTFLDIEKTPEPPTPKPEEPPPPPEPEEPEPEPEQPAVVEPPQPEQVYKEPEAEPTPEPAPAEPIAKGFQELAPPTAVPDRLPEVNPTAPPVRAEDFSGVGVAGGVAAGTTGGESRNAAKDPPKGDEDGEGDAPSGPVDVNVVEERPRLANGAEMERVMQRLYPALLRDAGVTGQAVLSFVIDAAGRVESGTVQVVSSTHEAFGSASVQAAEKFRFRPAKIGGRPVRVAITMPISWTLDKG